MRHGKIIEAKPSPGWFNPAPVTLLVQDLCGWRQIGRYRSVSGARQAAKKRSIKIEG